MHLHKINIKQTVAVALPCAGSDLKAVGGGGVGKVARLLAAGCQVIGYG